MENKHLIGVLVGMSIAIFDFLLMSESPLFIPLLAIALIAATSQWLLDFFNRSKNQKEIEEKFPEFVRNLVGSVKSGMPINKAVIHVSHIDYGALSPHIKKLANKLEWNVPLHRALISFGNETGSKVIKRAIVTVIEAEQSGGNIEDVLESMTSSLIEIKTLKDKRRAAIHGQIVQSYVIYIVFLMVMIVIQNFLMPWISGVQDQTKSFGDQDASIAGTTFSSNLQKVNIRFSSFEEFIITTIQWLSSLNGVFMMMSLIQGLFAGLVIGKLSEGEARLGWKHSLIMMTMSFITISFSQAL